MTRWTTQDLSDYMYKKATWDSSHQIQDKADPGPESSLQAKCEKWLNDRGYPYIHDRSRGKNKKGQILDLHIYLPGGRHIVLELKARGNKLSKEQRETYRRIMYLGHEIHEVRSFKRFLEIVSEGG